MFLYNFKYELKLLVRNKWLPILSLILVSVFLFATYNGAKKTEKRMDEIVKIEKEHQKRDANLLKLLDSVEKGLPVKIPSYYLPSDPMNFGRSYPEAAIMKPNKMSAISIGQSDIFSDVVMVETLQADYTIDFTKMTSSVQLLFGSFDLVFVIIYLLPLIIIAFSYNILSAEKERGGLRLLASQPISLYKWIFQKMVLRFFWISVICVVALVLAFLVNGVSLNQVDLFKFIGVTLVYTLFWFSLCFLINLIGGSSAKNAVLLLGFWVLLILLIPSALNQIGNSIYPIPSRNKLVNEMRELKVDVAKRQDEILDNYLRDHPEYATKDGENNYNFWHSYMASQELVASELEPLFSQYQNQLESQQLWIKKWVWLSPSLVIYKELNGISGNSTDAYQNYKKQVLSFSKIWRNHLVDMLYKKESVNLKSFKALPVFKYEPLPPANHVKSTIILVVYVLGLCFLGVFLFKMKVKKGQAILNN